jgi:glycosyltransferase involved in cell wall biosynthesis
MKVLLLSRYGPLGASSRLRSYQYLPHLAAAGIEVTVAPLLGDDYVAALYGGGSRRGPALRGYLGRLSSLFGARHYDAIWVEYEALPWLPALFELALLPRGVPLLADYDDAVFHRYDRHRLGLVRALLGRKIDAVMARAAVVTAGNDYLAERARSAGAKRVELLPTVVDVGRYGVVPPRGAGPLTIGWIGSPATAGYLRQLLPALAPLAAAHGARLLAVGANPQQLAGLPVEVRPWTEAGEVAAIQEFDIGIMPLPDGPFERGKCGYKLIQYMACGKPVVASPVGVNQVIVRPGENGFLAAADAQWQEDLAALLQDAALRARLGAAGRATVEQGYSLQGAAPRLAALLRDIARPAS